MNPVREQLKKLRKQVERRAAASLRKRLGAFAGGWGLGNNYGFIEKRVATLPASWPKLFASVIIPVYNRKEILGKTLAGLTLQTYPRHLFEVIIADDGSTDHPETLVEELSKELDLRIVHQSRRGFGAGAARNLGMRTARGEVLILLDSDMLPAPGLLAAMMRWFHAFSGPVVVIGDRKFINTDALTREQIARDFDTIRRLPEIPAHAEVRVEDAPTVDWRRRGYQKSEMLKQHDCPYRSACSGNLALRRALMFEVGGFDETYQHWGGEDTELGYRLHRRGSYFIPDLEALAFHQEHAPAIVREEHARVTRQMTISRIPHRRPHVSGEKWVVPKISVLIPVTPSHRGAVASTVESVRAQSYDDLEICLGETASDSLLDALDEAVRASRGEYALVVEPGDRLDKDAAGKMLAQFEKNPVVALVRAGPCMFRIRDYYRVRRQDRNDGHFLFLKLASRGVVIQIPRVGRSNMPTDAESIRDLIGALRSGDARTLIAGAASDWMSRSLAQAWTKR